MFGLKLERGFIILGHDVAGNRWREWPSEYSDGPRVACESVGNVVLIEGHDFLYADGRADFLGHAGLFVRREDAHHIGHVAVSHDFDACLGGRAEAQQGGADLDVPQVSLVTSPNERACEATVM